jgi:hypothetical protein
MEDISKKLVAQFVDCLESRLAQPPEPSPPAEARPAEPETAQRTAAVSPDTDGGVHLRPAPERDGSAQDSESEAIDLLVLARGPVLKRFAPLGLGALCLLGLAFWLGRLRGRRDNRA